MYTQAMDTMGKDGGVAKPKPVRSAEDAAREDQFEARIADGEFVEPRNAGGHEAIGCGRCRHPAL